MLSHQKSRFRNQWHGFFIGLDLDPRIQKISHCATLELKLDPGPALILWTCYALQQCCGAAKFVGGSGCPRSRSRLPKNAVFGRLSTVINKFFTCKGSGTCLDWVYCSYILFFVRSGAIFASIFNRISVNHKWGQKNVHGPRLPF